MQAQGPTSTGDTQVMIGKLMSAQPRLALDVIGHTDPVGSLESNLALSRARAKAVADALSAKCGVRRVERLKQ